MVLVFSAGLIDYLLNWGLATKPAMIIPLGLGFAALYYVVFVWAIKQFNIPTPGRFEDEAENTKLDTVDISSFSLTLMEKLGGPQNLEAVDSCITRLRLTVKNADLINENEIKALGAAGVIKSGKSVQIIVGTKAEMIADEMKKLQVGGKGRIQNDIDNTSAPNF
jgi:PTS system N-acetylglucosamine-specific IIC component